MSRNLLKEVHKLQFCSQGNELLAPQLNLEPGNDLISLLSRLNEFNSYTDLYSLIKALELTFTIDENLTIPNATQILWGYRNFNFDNVNKLTVPTKPYRTEDGKEVLILTSNFYDFIIAQNLLDE